MKNKYFLFYLTVIFLYSKNIQSQNIVDTYPILNATNVPTNTNPHITFDLEIDASTFSLINLNVFGSFTGKISGTLSGVGTNTITFNPDQDFKPGELIFLSASTALGNYTTTFSIIGGISSANFDNGDKIITNNASRAFAVFAADLDNDGDIDVLSASINDDKIAWYENDGNGNFGPQQVISTALDEAWAVYAADLDNDGDMDVISGSRLDNKVAWYENDGNGNFGPQQIVTTSASYIRRIHVSDIDGDGFLDILCTPSSSSGMYWFKNNNNGIWSQELISAGTAALIRAADMNNDGKMDIVYVTDRARLREQIEGNAFDFPYAVSPGSLSIFGLDITDLDGNGYQDVVIATRYNGIHWIKNNGNSNFEPMQEITTVTETDFAYGVYGSDLDGDGDMDVVSASSNDHKIAWYENDGLGNFGPQQVITTNAIGARNVYTADLDGDGDLDIISASGSDNKIAWYENTNSTLNTSDVDTFYQSISLYPNPAKNEITIKTKDSSLIENIDIYDMSGRLVMSILGNHASDIKIDLSNLNASTYFITIKNTTHQTITKKIVVE
ncbi:FG-GAP-like repeat-containing protein [Xanthomarina gelatinilytica]|uniref:FG-GAP-like repeat-containing protein n=1 Tax=Xanthomarina gelatinilytica TaxID=1137281 RepID=UPI003AA986A3